MASPAPACKAALAEATRLWPNRSRVSDGIMGDARHKKSKSDHNDGNAFDLTHDPAGGCDAHKLVRELVARGDERVSYAISDGRIWSRLHAKSGWRTYTGSNPHTKHAHVSIFAACRNDISVWWPNTMGAGKPERVGVVVANWVDSLEAPNGGTWHLAEDGGIFTDDDGAGGPQAPFYGSVPGSGGLGGTVALKLLPFKGGYRVAVQHPKGAISYFHYPAL